MRRRAISRVLAVCGLAAVLAAPGGCIVVSSTGRRTLEVERRRADAQYLAARVELERINLEREKAGLAPIQIPPPPDCVR